MLILGTFWILFEQTRLRNKQYHISMKSEMYVFIEKRKRNYLFPTEEYQNSMPASRWIIYGPSTGTYTRIENSIAAIISRGKGERERDKDRNGDIHHGTSGEHAAHTEPPNPVGSAGLSSCLCSLRAFTTIDVRSYIPGREILWEIESGHAAFAIASRVHLTYARFTSGLPRNYHCRNSCQRERVRCDGTKVDVKEVGRSRDKSGRERERYAVA